MTTVQGLPVHVLLVHFIVVLAPLTAALATLCVVWPAARRRLVWLVAALGATVLVLTPLTAEAGEWLKDREGSSPALQTHAERGDTMIYFALALAISVLLLVALHVLEGRGRPVPKVAAIAIAAVVILGSAATALQVYRVGDSGARAVWGGQFENQ